MNEMLRNLFREISGAKLTSILAYRHRDEGKCLTRCLGEFPLKLLVGRDSVEPEGIRRFRLLKARQESRPTNQFAILSSFAHQLQKARPITVLIRALPFLRPLRDSPNEQPLLYSECAKSSQPPPPRQQT